MVVLTFDEVIVPHLDAARRLARWLMRNSDDAEDAVQEASLRAVWIFPQRLPAATGVRRFLKIVRNTCRGWHGNGIHAVTDSFDEEHHGSANPKPDPETLRFESTTCVDR